MTDINEALDDAIRTVLAQYGRAGILTAWALATAETTDIDGHTYYATWAPPGSTFHTQLGLHHTAIHHITNEAEEDE